MEQRRAKSQKRMRVPSSPQTTRLETWTLLQWDSSAAPAFAESGRGLACTKCRSKGLGNGIRVSDSAEADSAEARPTLAQRPACRAA